MNYFDYNKLGNEYVSIAIARPPLGIGFFGAEAIKTISVAEALIREGATRASAAGTSLERLQCAFERLEGTLLISKRVLEGIQRIPHQLLDATAQAPCFVCIPDTAIFVDFSSLLYHAGSTLDILSQYYANESGVKHKGKFYGSRAAIYNTQPADIRADYLWNDLAQFEQEIDTIFKLSDNHEFKGLRNYIAHENSVLGLSSYVFSAHCISPTQALIFDCEIEITSTSTGQRKLFPISTTTEKIVSYVTWIVCRTAICYLSRSKHGAILYNPASIPGWGPDKFFPIWENPLAIFSEHISDDRSHPRYSVAKVTWDGFVTQTEHLQPNVANHVVQLPSSAC